MNQKLYLYILLIITFLWNDNAIKIINKAINAQASLGTSEDSEQTRMTHRLYR